MNPKVAVILVLVLIALLFAGGVVAGGVRKEEKRTADQGPPPFAEMLGNLFGATQPGDAGVDLGLVKVAPESCGDARTGVRLQKEASCTITVPADHEHDFRNLVIKVTSGSVVVHARIDGEEHDTSLGRDQQTTIPVRRSGLSFTLTAGAQPAAVTLE